MVTLVRQDHKLILICILLDFWIVIAGLSIVKCPLIISFPRFAASSLAWKESHALQGTMKDTFEDVKWIP